MRKYLFTHGPNRLSGGRLRKRHLSDDIRVRDIVTESAKWPHAFAGLRIGHVSDFHLGDLLPLDRALEVVTLLADQQPDLVACTGDVVDLHNEGCEPLLRALAEVDAPLGSFLVLGNHDELKDRRGFVRMAHEAGLHVLQNDAVDVVHNGSTLRIAGVRWARRMTQCCAFVRRACDPDVHLLLSHNPKSFREAVRMDIPLTLAGHTHGGQVALRKRPRANLALAHRHTAGLYEHDGSKLFVTTGVGAWFPLRVNCPAEIAMITVNQTAAEDN